MKLINKKAYANTLPTDIAEYDFSLLIHVPFGMETISLLFDTGISADGVVKHAMQMGLELARAKRLQIENHAEKKECNHIGNCCV